MATDTDEAQSPEQLERLAGQHGLSPADIPGGLTQLPEWIKLAKELGMDIKDLLANENISAVTIVNRTKHTLFFMNEHDRVSGEFTTVPPDQIAPGETGSFISQQSQNSFLGLTGDESSVDYAIGEPENTVWTIHWDNPEKGDNKADFKLDPPNGRDRPDGTHVRYEGAVEFAQHGSKMIPFQFVIRDAVSGGGDDGQVDHNSCVVTVVNHTSQSLFLAETHSDQGEFVSFPDDEIPAGGSSTFQVSEKRRPDHDREGVMGYARYTVTQDPAQCIWTIAWQNPESGPNVASDRLDGPQAEHYQRGPAEIPEDQKDNAPVRFTLRDAGGGGGTGPHPNPQPHPQPHPEPQVEPQPAVQQSDDPTLRLGDKSVDGWVEYAQQLLNTFGATLTVDGDFGHGTQQAVMTFQGQRGLLVDGVIGYQTWAALRQEDPRPPSTDGREPHTYVEQGPEARWSTQELAIQYEPSNDTLAGSGTNVGNVPLNPGEWQATANATSVADGRQVQVHMTLFTGDGQPAPPGGIIFFGLGNASQELGPGEWDVFAWMPSELGGDDTQGRITIP